MRVGIDAHVLGKNIGGVEPYVEAVVRLVPRLAPHHQFIVFLNRHAFPRYAANAPANVQYVSLPASDPLLERSVVLPWMIRRHRLDVIQVQRVAPLFPGRCRVLLTVHDLVPLKHPERYPDFRNRLIRMLTPGSIRSAAMIVTPTATIAREVAQHFPDVRSPIHPFYSGVDLSQFNSQPSGGEGATLQHFGLSRPFLLTVGAIEARRNLELLMHAVKQLDNCGSPQLAIVGSIRDGAYVEQVKALARSLGIADRIRWLGFVSHAHLADLYRSAAVFATASWDEGFNLSPLEAMASGAPVLCSDIPVHRELYESCAQLLPVDSPDRYAKAISGILHDPSSRSAAAQASCSCVQRLSWEAMAARMGTYIEELQ